MTITLLLILLSTKSATVKQTECTRPTEVKSANSSCYLYHDYVVRVVERNDGPEQAVYVSPLKKTGTSSDQCREAA